GDSELVKLQLHQNDWFVRHARRALHERAWKGQLSKDTTNELEQLFDQLRSEPTARKLRVLWALYLTSREPLTTLWPRKQSTGFYLRYWLIRLLLDKRKFCRVDPTVIWDDRLLTQDWDEANMSLFEHEYLCLAFAVALQDSHPTLREKIARALVRS